MKITDKLFEIVMNRTINDLSPLYVSQLEAKKIKMEYLSLYDKTYPSKPQPPIKSIEYGTWRYKEEYDYNAPEYLEQLKEYDIRIKLWHEKYNAILKSKTCKFMGPYGEIDVFVEE